MEFHQALIEVWHDRDLDPYAALEYHEWDAAGLELMRLLRAPAFFGRTFHHAEASKWWVGVAESCLNRDRIVFTPEEEFMGTSCPAAARFLASAQPAGYRELIERAIDQLELDAHAINRVHKKMKRREENDYSSDDEGASSSGEGEGDDDEAVITECGDRWFPPERKVTPEFLACLRDSVQVSGFPASG